MEKIGILISPPIAFLVFIFIFSVLYCVAGRFAASTRKTREKLSTYACGEDIPGFKFQFGYNPFFIFALFFTIMHVAALVIATLPSVSPGVYFGIFYLSVIFLSVIGMMLYDEKQTDQSDSEAECD
ncbi:MAG: hypothetical protein N2115_06075 [bacterium]|nr:hypothetical protein [bacterium]